MQVAVALELTVRCKACGEPVALNAVGDRATCGACHRIASISRETWSLLLADPIAHAGVVREGDEIDTTLELGDGRYRRVFRRAPVACARCGVAIPPATIEAGLARTRAVCLACSATIPVRAVDGLGPPGTLLVGEQPELPPGEAATPTAWICERCGGPLDDPGHGRPIACRYCKTFHTLPDARGASDPARAVRRFFVVVERSVSSAAELPLPLGVVEDVIGDEDGGFVVSGEAFLDGRFLPALFALDPALRLRWIHRGISPRRVWAAGGVVFVEPPRFGAFDARSGVPRSVAELGARLRDVGPCSIAPGPGSIVGVRHGALVRFSLEGVERPLFAARASAADTEPPEGPGFFGRLFGRALPAVPEEEAPSELRPDHVELVCALPGGGLVLVGKLDYRAGTEARAYGPSGGVEWSVPLGGLRVGPADRLVPAPGGAFLATHERVLWLRAGGESEVVGPSVLRGGPGTPRVVAQGDGSLALFHGRGCVRWLRVDGTILRSNAAALEADRRA